MVIFRGWEGEVKGGQGCESELADSQLGRVIIFVRVV